jgi:alpha-beta hydrolase superfamily lysophospholipase
MVSGLDRCSLHGLMVAPSQLGLHYFDCRFELGIVAYERGSVTQLLVLLKDIEYLDEDQMLINTIVDLPTVYNTWVDYSLQEDAYTVNVSLWRSFTPLFTPEDQAAMELTEVLFDLEDGSIASLVYKTKPGNDKAVLYFPGRADSFAHPHVLEMYEAEGYDFYSLDPRYCGRTRRFMNDTQYGHWIDDFDVYQEEINLTLEFMKNQHNYSSIVANCHSTGALVALNYVMQLQDESPNQQEPFDAYVLNGPFLDWGYVSTVEELVLENAGMLEGVLPNPMEANGLSTFHTRFWILNRFNTTWRPIIQAHLHSAWAQAATDVQTKIKSRSSPITRSPVLLIASQGDNTVQASESEDRIALVASNYSTVILEHNSHDVTFSFTKELNDIAIAEITSWLESVGLGMEPSTTSTNTGNDITPPGVAANKDAEKVSTSSQVEDDNSATNSDQPTQSSAMDAGSAASGATTTSELFPNIFALSITLFIVSCLA